MAHSYEEIAGAELKKWQNKMLRRPSLFNNFSKKIPNKN